MPKKSKKAAKAVRAKKPASRKQSAKSRRATTTRKTRKKLAKATQWTSVIDELPRNVTDEVKTEAKDFVNQLLNDSNEFAQRQGKKIATYLEQYARGELTAAELKECMNDVALLTEMHAAKESLAGKLKFQKVALDNTGILLKGALAALL